MFDSILILQHLQWIEIPTFADRKLWSIKPPSYGKCTQRGKRKHPSWWTDRRWGKHSCYFRIKFPKRSRIHGGSYHIKLHAYLGKWFTPVYRKIHLINYPHIRSSESLWWSIAMDWLIHSASFHNIDFSRNTQIPCRRLGV